MKILEKTLLKTVSKHMQDKAALVHSQHGFTNGKLWLVSLRACSVEMVGVVGEGRAVFVYLDFCKACYVVPLQPNW